MKKYTLELYDRIRVNKELLTEVIKLFVIKEKQSRFLEFIDSPKRYHNFVDEFLNDPRNLKSDLITEIPNNQQEFKDIAAKLKEFGAKDKAYLISRNDEDDGKIGRLEDILGLVYTEGFIYCLETKLGYYEGHENWRYILSAK